MTHHLLTSVLASGLALASVAFAQPNGDVSWSGLSHFAPTDRRPIMPLEQEAFSVLFQSARNDLTAARVGFDDGDDGSVVWVDATVERSFGPYDLWRANIPAGVSRRASYIIEAIDGADRDYLSTTGVTDAQPPTTSFWKLDYDTLTHAPYGSTPTTRGTVFRVWAPGATTAVVRGNFTTPTWSVSVPLTRRGEDWIGLISSARVNNRYKYVFNNTLFKPDPRGRLLDNADGYNTVIHDPLAHQWVNNNFTPAPRERWVIYQLHVGSFAGLNDPRGTFTRPARYREVAARADHLTELGINAVMINPINEFPGSQSGGYNPLTQFSWESSYGTPDDLKFMIDTLQGRGIAVILDGVWNHVSSTDNFLWNFDSTQIYFDTPAVDTPWGAQVDFDRLPVFNSYADSVEHVLGEFRFDGYRLDAVFDMLNNVQGARVQQLLRGATDRVRQRFSDAHVIGEIYNNSSFNTSPAGIYMDGQYHEAYKNAVQDAINAAASGNPDMTRLANALDGSGIWVDKTHVMNYFELHDDAWTLSGGQREVRTIDPTAPHDDRFATGRTKLGNGMTLLAQGMPAILMGTEWLESNGFEQQKIDWSKKNTYREIFDFYRDVIRLRTTQPEFFATSPINTFHVNDGSNVLAFERFTVGGGSYVVVANFSNTDFATYELGLPRSGNWGVLLNSEDARYRGRNVGTLQGCIPVISNPLHGFAQRTSLSIPAHSLMILQHNPISAPPTITQQPESVASCFAQPQTFTVGGLPASGGTGIGVLWQVEEPTAPGTWRPLVNGLNTGIGTISGSTSTTLAVSFPVGTQLNFRALVTTIPGGCTGVLSQTASWAINRPCGFGDIGGAGGEAVSCGDGNLDNNDFIVFINRFFDQDPLADIGGEGGEEGSDGILDNNDFIIFIGWFFAGC
jgi:1,4-alpha-glucan branching enzyme